MQCVIASVFCTLALSSPPRHFLSAILTHRNTQTHTSFCSTMYACKCVHERLHYVFVWRIRDVTGVTDEQALLKFWLEYYLYR